MCVQFRSCCSLHCDAKYKGYYGANALECLTIFCDRPVLMMVVKADLRLTYG